MRACLNALSLLYPRSYAARGGGTLDPSPPLAAVFLAVPSHDKQEPIWENNQVPAGLGVEKPPLENNTLSLLITAMAFCVAGTGCNAAKWLNQHFLDW